MQHSIFLCFAIFSLLLAQGIVQARHIECRVREAVSDVVKLKEMIKKCENYQCDKTDGGTAHNTYYDQQKNKRCGCLDIPQNTCSLSCFNSGLQEIKHHLNDTKPLSRFSIMITACKDELCAKPCETSTSTFGNWYSFLEELHRAFQKIATKAASEAPTGISTNVY